MIKRQKVSRNLKGGLTRRAILVGMVLVAFLALLPARGRLLGGVGRFLVKKDSVERVDLAVVLAGEYWDRAREAVDAYKEGYARQILLSKEIKPLGYEDMLKIGIKVPLKHEVSQKILSYYGVPSRAIAVADEEAASTYQEAEIVRRYVQARGIKSVMVITSAYHTRRACLIISSRLGKGIRVVCQPSRYDDFYPKAWWRQRRQARNVLLEYEKLLFYCPLILWNWLVS